ncbi:hypothetical protein LSTR_LSTR002613 [Laodelphax striatellus]|uniref:Luc7-like protein 3 n=1 Tax=Laodelphax striatellus TaxID=195883 RepID=A0A482XMJ4_LAOST|nr:hypothetical protein LSTR_LSTR002613 [Laodelphax striatellus]
MAVSAAAALLDELMGRNRNIAPSEKTKPINWEDPEFCKFFLVKFCPHDLFVNTRADLGVCSKVHDDEAKALFDKSTSYKKQSYEDEFIHFSQGMINEVERKISKGKQRLALIGKNDPQSSLTPAQTQRNLEQIALLSEKINNLVNEAEQMGIQGNVEQAQGLMKLCDQLKEEREALRKQNDNSHWSQTAELAAAQEKQMEVCEVCGAFLIVGDAQSRIDDHLMGKQHVGYAKLRGALDEIVNLRAKQREDKERQREEERKERYRLREEEEKKRDRDRDERRRKRDDDNSDARAIENLSLEIYETLTKMDGIVIGIAGTEEIAVTEIGTGVIEAVVGATLIRMTAGGVVRETEEIAAMMMITRGATNG